MDFLVKRVILYLIILPLHLVFLQTMEKVVLVEQVSEEELDKLKDKEDKGDKGTTEEHKMRTSEEPEEDDLEDEDDYEDDYEDSSDYERGDDEGWVPRGNWDDWGFF